MLKEHYNAYKLIGSILLILYLSSQQAALAKPKLAYKIGSDQWRTGTSVYVKAGKTVLLKLRVAGQIKTIHWYQIIPDVSQYYKNANFPWEPNPYTWVGFGHIAYEKVALTAFKDKPIIAITPTLLENNRLSGAHLYRSDLGSFWFQAEATLTNGQVIKTAGLEDNDYRGLSPEVFRLSYIEDTNYVGYLTSFFNVPGLFGSVPYQSKNYVGVDCADVLMATEALYQRKKLIDYNVAKVVNLFKTIATFKMRAGSPNRPVKWNEDFHSGDFIAVRYTASRQFAHIGVLYQDANKNKILDGPDLIIHAGPAALHFSRLDAGGFDGLVKLLKNRNQ